ncbi:MAG: hypothetical protein GXY05_08545, partial [Clostridiales bacterium]|nr:hypothetical protein [Clostridiales bacterium]
NFAADGGKSGTGYILANAFKLPTSTYAPDLAREAVELAYSRLGSLGVYNQMKRFSEFYTDCAAFVTYCYYNVGIKWSSTDCAGISNWANAQTGMKNVILWDGKSNNQTTAAEIQRHMDEHHSSVVVVPPGIPVPIPAPEPALHAKDGMAIDLKDVILYDRHVDKNVLDNVQAGDVIFFNHFEDVYDQFGCVVGRYQVIEREDAAHTEGHDHVAIVVGVTDDGNVLNYIHSTPQSSRPDAGVIMSTGTTNRDNIVTIEKIIRPTGCARLP